MRLQKILVEPSNIKKTVFKSPYSAYKCLVMNFGMTNTPAAFVTMMNKVLNGLSNTMCHLDNTIIYSNTITDH